MARRSSSPASPVRSPAVSGGHIVRPKFLYGKCRVQIVDDYAAETPTIESAGPAETMRASHFCSACGKVQPAAPVDYFTFFGLPRKLNLDTAALEKEFYALSRKLASRPFCSR